MSEALCEADSKRNAALTASDSYRSKTIENAKFNIPELMTEVADKMPLFNDEIAGKIAQKQLDISRETTLDSIRGRIKLQEGLDIGGCAKYAKTQKKDSLYNWLLRNVSYSAIKYIIWMLLRLRDFPVCLDMCLT